MAVSQSLRRAAALSVLAGALTVAPAQAAADEVTLAVAPATAHPGGTVTVTVTVTNVNAFSVLHPTARVFGANGFTTLAGCTGAVSCSTVDSAGYQGVLAEALSGGESATVTFTLAVSPDAPDTGVVLQGQLAGSNYASERVSGPRLTVDARTDAGVGIAVTPRPGLLGGRFDVAVRLSGNGPDPLRSATVTASLPPGMSATAGPGCVPGRGTATCTFGAVPVGGSAEARFSVPFGLLTVGLPVTFTATRTATVPEDVNPGNDRASTTCTVITPLLVSC
ncbi:DUF11 domain-containing protein [Amycolatopsis suaedae]|uniref:DUF11 domain-containing protein n=1 Tax=Amycolatopsis suaedae TaxID=2510978 RepID=A0A4Q7JDJ2_9PSEU|nr:DUF11 domain-containing protein [Amycolatopsis suaedae]RZQ64703.1 hypothetical protein EWH70_07370 [Amycolatopsis suaedae]